MKMFSQAIYAGAIYAALVLGSWAGFAVTAEADEASAIIKDHRIGFVQTSLAWSVYQSADGKTECPQGMNAQGPSENFKALYPNGGAMANTKLVREGLRIFPNDKPAQFPYREVQGNIALGLNLDGKVGPKDFTSPDGEKGIDNALYRATGCTIAFRGPYGSLYDIGEFMLIRLPLSFMRLMIEIDGVDNLENDDSVEVTTYRGRDPIVLDSSGGKVAPGGSERIDVRYGKKLIQHLHGRIENGVLITDPIKDGVWPWVLTNVPIVLHVHDMRLRLKLSLTNAEGLIAGYFDVDSVYRWLTSLTTHQLGYDHLDAPEFYWTIRDNADAYPDQNGTMTAISAALTVKMTQVFIVHPDEPANKQTAAFSAPEAPPSR